MKKFLLISASLVIASASVFASGASTSAREREVVNRHVVKNLSAADLIGMYAAPVQILPPQGAGKSIMVTKIVLRMTRTSTAFTGGGVVIAQYGSAANGAGTQALTSTIAATVLTGAAGATETARAGADFSDLAAASIQNAGLYLSNQTAAFANGTGTATLEVFYRVY